MSNYDDNNNHIKSSRKNSTNSMIYIFPFKNNEDIDFSENKKLIYQQDNDYNDNSSSNNINEVSFNLEKSLSNFLEYSLECYKKKLYENLIDEIEINEYLYYIGSREAFDILIIKIKCLMKLMIEKYDNDLNNSGEIQIPSREYIIKIQHEFLKIEKIINKKDKYEYEIITQIYCKYLIYLIKFAQKREEYCKSLAYITLGINMMKIFFVKRQLTKNIKTYKIYIYLYILLINQLIGEQNFKQSLLYCRNLLKIIEMTMKIIYGFKIKEKKMKQRNDKNINELFRCTGIAYTYIGICFENQKNSYQALEAYRQSFYFFMKLKSRVFIGIGLNKEKLSYDNNFIKLSHIFLSKQKLKIEEDLKKLEERILLNLMLSRKEEEQKNEYHEKKKKLKLISSGLSGDQKKFNQIENKIYKNILTPKNQKIISKLDSALISLAFPKKRAKRKKGTLKKSLSLNIMDSLCHLEMYNKLMSKKYHNFIMDNNNLKLSNPKDQEGFIQNIHSYLTSTMEIKPNNEKNKKVNLYKEDSSKPSRANSFSTLNKFKTKAKISSAKTPRKPHMTNFQFIDSHKDDIIYNNRNKSSKKLFLKKNNSCASLKIDIPKSCNNNNNNLCSNSIDKSLSETYITSKITNMLNSNSKSKYKYRTKSSRTIKQSTITDFGKIKNLKKKSEKKNHYLSPKYFKKYMYLDKLTKKELDFQKAVLGLKWNNSKLYYNGLLKELYVVGKDKEEEMNKNYMIIHEKIDEKVSKSLKEYEKMINNNLVKRRDSNVYKNLLKMNKGKNLFKSQKNMGINLEYDFFDFKKRFDFNGEEEEDVKKINEKSIFTLDDKIKNINNKIKERIEKLKKH